MSKAFNRARACEPFCHACRKAIPPKFVVMRSTERLRFDASDPEPWLEVTAIETVAGYCSCECVQNDLVALMCREGMARNVVPPSPHTPSTCARCSHPIDVNEFHRHYALEMLGPEADCAVALMGCSIAVVCPRCAELEQTIAPSPLSAETANGTEPLH